EPVDHEVGVTGPRPSTSSEGDPGAAAGGHALTTNHPRFRRGGQTASARRTLGYTLRETMADTLSILVIDDNAIRASIIEAGLREAGHAAVQVITDIDGVARRIGEIAPDVVIVDLENPNRDVLEHFFAISRSLKRPIAMFVDKSDPSEIEAAVEAGVSAYVVDGLRKDRIKPILDMAIV